MQSIEEKIYPTYIGLSPHIILERNQEIIKKYGLDDFLKQKEFKRAREMYQTAVYALGMTAKTGNFYWVTPGNDNTPDSYLIWVKGDELFVECVELTLWNERVEEMWEIIEKKINKQYPHYFSIVIHDSHDDQNVHSQYFQEIHERLKDRSISAGAVRFWMEIKNKEPKNVLVGELYPNNDWAEFSTAHILSGYSLAPQIIKIDVISKPRRITFSSEELNGITLPPLPELSWQASKP